MADYFAYWPMLLGVAGILISGWAGAMFLFALGDLRNSEAGRIRSRVRDIAEEDAHIADADVNWLTQLAASSSSGWPLEVAKRLEPAVKLLDRGGIAKDAARLGQSGMTHVLTAADMQRVRSTLAVVLGLVLMVMGLAGGIGQGILFLGLGFILGVRLPSFYLAGLATSRDRRITRDLPEMADMLSLGVKAGMSFDRALGLYTERFEGPLAAEYATALNQWAFGALTRDEALDRITSDLVNEPVARLNAAVQQALRLGSPLGRVLEEQSADARTSFKSSVQMQIGEAPVKMLLPMGALILPAMLILLLSPLMMGVLGNS